MSAYLSSLNPASLLNALPGGIAQGLIWALLALGVYISFRMLNIPDMTVDGAFTTGGAVGIMLVLSFPKNIGFSPVVIQLLAIFAAFAAGALCGTITGLLHTKLGIPDILAGILTQISLWSVNLHILLNKATQSVPLIGKNTINLFISMNVKVLPRTILISALFCTAVIILLYLYLNTEHGSALRAAGANLQMVRAQGVNTDRIKIIGLALGDGLVGMAGAMYAHYKNVADINMGRGAIVVGLAAVIIGEVLANVFFGKRLNLKLSLIFVVIGSIIYYLVYEFVIWLKFPTEDMKLLTAIIVAIFLAIPYLSGQRKTSFAGLKRRNAHFEKQKGGPKHV